MSLIRDDDDPRDVFLAVIAIVVTLLALLVLPGCASAPPVEPPPVPAPTTKMFAVHVTDAQGVGIVGARARLDSGDPFRTLDFRPLTAETDPNGRAFFSTVPWDTRQVQLTVTADGFESRSESILIPDQPSTDWLPIILIKIVPILPRLRVDGRRFVTVDGRGFRWNGFTAFRLVELVASGREADADRFLAWAAAHGVTIVRVLAMARHLFILGPETGRKALPAALALVARHGVYVEVVALADSGSYTFNHDEHIRAIGAICEAATNCVLELANEVLPRHPTQDVRLGDVEYLRSLRKLVPASVPVSLGSTHADQDESDALKDGDFLTIHGDRQDGDAGWRWVRHTNEQRVLSERIGKPAVNDEPKRDDLSPDKHLAMALLCRLYGLGDTFHSAAGLQAQIPVGDELAAFLARRRGWLAIPPDFVGGYKNAGHFDSPVEHFALAVRAYSSIRGSDGYTLVFGIGRGGPQIGWSPRWPRRELVLSEGATQLYRVSR